MVIQMGYVTLFAAAFPLASALSFVCTAIEFKSDFWRLTHVTRRPPPSQAADLGAWLWVLSALSLLSVLSNLAIFAYSTDQLRQWAPQLYAASIGQHNPFAFHFHLPHMQPLQAAHHQMGHHHQHAELATPCARASAALTLLVIEHALLVCALLLCTVLPAEPEQVAIARARRDWVMACKAKRQRQATLSLAAWRVEAAMEQHRQTSALEFVTPAVAAALEGAPSASGQLSTTSHACATQGGSPSAAGLLCTALRWHWPRDVFSGLLQSRRPHAHLE